MVSNAPINECQKKLLATVKGLLKISLTLCKQYIEGEQAVYRIKMLEGGDCADPTAWLNTVYAMLNLLYGSLAVCSVALSLRLSGPICMRPA